MSYEDKKLVLSSISKNSILCSDSHKSYIRFIKELGLNHIKIKRDKKKEVLYHVQHVNWYHIRHREWSFKFHGVATKYLNFYLI
ncbi:protein of unknown function [Tepidibacter aestuarii]|nr:protein of unknown function [Tepidibacter aestuarii]